MQQNDQNNHQEETTTEAAAKEPETLTRKGKRAAQAMRQASRGQKLAIALLLLFASGWLGLVVGYTMVGDGSFADAFKPSTYKHMYDLVFKTSP